MLQKILVFVVVLLVLGTSLVLSRSIESTKDHLSQMSMRNIEALAGSDGETVNTAIYHRDDDDCTYKFTGKANTKVSLSNAGISTPISLTTDSSGEATYTASDAKTSCSSGGNELCTDRYCPVAFWN